MSFCASYFTSCRRCGQNLVVGKIAFSETVAAQGFQKPDPNRAILRGVFEHLSSQASSIGSRAVIKIINCLIYDELNS